MDLLAANQILLLSCVLSAIGWVIAFMGLCFSSTMVVPLSWWTIAYELGLVVFVCTIVGTDRIELYRAVAMGFMAISVPYTTDEVARYIVRDHSALTASCVGYILLIVVQFFWLFLFGAQHEFFQTLRAAHPPSSYSYPSNHPDRLDAKGASTTIYPEVMVYNNPPPPSEETTVFVSPHANYTIPVVAIHSYQANPDDPNELSFDKNEVLHIHEQKGNWWQARKADGTVGMIPSNYVSPLPPARAHNPPNHHP
ncbi:hypothetical protein BX666DRAFT_1922285 [Dichotomocladium elegans]|nr:hypothetical protein BX666DRAFT_1922285 [Dichotomocladium elegans]